MIRENGQFLIRKRVGGDTSHVVGWTGHDAISELNAQGRATNTLTVEMGSDQVRFLVNGTEVSTQPRSAVDTDGVTGLRVNHFLNVHIDNLDLGMCGTETANLGYLVDAASAMAFSWARAPLRVFSNRTLLSVTVVANQ